jgi:integrase
VDDLRLALRALRLQVDDETATHDERLGEEVLRTDRIDEPLDDLVLVAGLHVRPDLAVLAQVAVADLAEVPPQEIAKLALWRLLVVTGVRRGEACGLTWLHVDLEAGTVTIAQQIVPVGGELLFAEPKTAAGLRNIPIDAGTVEALERHRETQVLERQVVGDPVVDRDLVFTKLDGESLNPRGVSQAFQVRRKNAGLPHVRLHDLRHGAATLELEGEVNLEMIRRRMGHARISTTIDLHARHEIESSERAAADTVAGLIDSRLQGVSKEETPRG